MRTWVLVLAVGLVVALGTPVAWWATRPAGSAGAPVLQPSPPASTGGPFSGPAPSRTQPRTVPASPAAVPDRRSPSRAAPQPRRLAIPPLGVDAPVTPVGVADGSMAIPRQARRVGWYRFGPAPGSRAGTVVLAGHVDSAREGAGALFQLRRVQVGQQAVVTLTGGRTVTYRVTAKETFVKRRLPLEQLFRRDGAARLVLITCGGPFNEKLSSYRDNLVVVAEPEA